KLKLEKGNDIDYLDFFVKGFKSLVDIKQEFDDFVKDYSSNGFISHSNVAFNNKLVFDFNFKNNEQHKTLLDNIIKEYVSNYININPNFIDKIEYNNISYNPYGPRIIDGREKSIFLSSKITYSPFKNSNKSLKLNINFELCGFNTLEEEVFYFIDSIEPNLFAMGDDKNLYPFEVNYSEYHRFDEHIGNFNKIKIMENELNEKYQNVASGDKLIFSFTPYNHLYEKMEHDVNMAGKKKLRFSVTLNNTINILKFYKIISGFKDKTLPEKPILQERPILDTKK
ncbi:hypothetical protein, partial [Mycoplasma elephantis]|uniref:hypothetical protein n=1 Tax=Mycoplasma elephantis TaxID=114882 RepID=UPI000561A508